MKEIAALWFRQLIAPIVAVGVALLMGAAFIAAVGQSPLVVYSTMAAGVFGNAYGWGQVLFKATPLVFTGLAVAVGFRAGLFNIGAEGQAYLAAFAIGVVGARLAPALPGFALVPILIVVGMVVGGLYGALPGFL